MAEFEVLWTPAALWALRSFPWSEAALIDGAVQKFASTGEGRVARLEGSAIRLRLYVPPYVVRLNLDRDGGVLLVAWIWRQG